MAQFVTEEQKVELQKNNWNIIPTCSQIVIYKDEFSHGAWIQQCKILGEDPSKEKLTLLVIGTK